MRGKARGAARLAAVFLAALALAGPASAAANPPAPSSLGAGATFDTLQAGTTTYRQVRVLSVSARNLMIAHAGGMASVRLRDLAPELQAGFGYSPAAEAAADAAEAATAQKQAKEAAAKAQSGSQRPKTATAFDHLLQSFGQAPEIRPTVDLRPKFSDLGLNVKNQGPRPSCAVFAIVSALEFQNAQLSGQAERFSEEYLVWATCKILKRPPRARPDAGAEGTEDSASLDTADEGFTLSEVVTALRAYGIPLQSSLPYSFARTPAADPPAAVIEEARSHQRVAVVSLPGRDQATRLANLVQALDAGVPVAIGAQWPPWQAIRTGYLSKQPPKAGTGHAVTLVGYENKTGAIEDTVFIFKNSWGVRWGAGGYGYVTYGYLNQNLEDAALLDVQKK